MSTAGFAFFVAAAGAAALPIGAVIGLRLNPGPRVTSALLAFGSGALLFALAVEIVAPAVEQGRFIAISSGMIMGGVAFTLLNQVANRRGAFLRKVALAASYLAIQRRMRERALLRRLAHVRLLQSLPPEDVVPLVHAARVMRLQPGEELFREGDAGSSLFLIEVGELEVIRGGTRVAILAPGDTVGEMAVVTGAARTATITALRPTVLFCIPKPAFDDLVKSAARVRDLVSELIKLRTEQLKERLLVSHTEADEWEARARERLQNREGPPSNHEIREAAEGQRDPALGIWMGNTLDAIPEGITLGATVTGVGALSWPLLAGVLTSNMPGAVSSSGLMHAAGMSQRRILWMWASNVLLSGLFGAIGNLFFTQADPQVFSVVTGTAAGAYIFMIAESSLPEAYRRGGAIVGSMTLLGFLAGLGVKALS
jgi:CRP-like cAMP-binding protein